jgi:hypothetical protein
VYDFGTVVPYDYEAITQEGYFVVLKGHRGLSGIEEKGQIPSEPILSESYPTPFNPTSTVEFFLPSSAGVLLVTYDMLGKEVRELVNRKMVAGTHRAVWDGKDSNRQRVTSDPYFYQIIVNGKVTQSKKVVLLK